MSKLFPPAAPEGVPRNMMALMNQGKWWRTGDGIWVRIKEMTPAHRRAAASHLMRAAKVIEDRYSFFESRGLWDAPDGVWNSIENAASRRGADPEAWLRGTKLYRKLTKKMAIDMRVDDCPARVYGMHGTIDRLGCCMDCGKRVDPPVPYVPQHFEPSDLTDAYEQFYDPDFGALTYDDIRNRYQMGQEL